MKVVLVGGVGADKLGKRCEPDDECGEVVGLTKGEIEGMVEGEVGEE
jgi:hypothetical protein